MDDVDDILIPILKQTGWSPADDVSSFNSFTSAHIIGALFHCFKIIKPDLELPEKLPKSKAAQYRVSSSFSLAIQDMGFSGESGYQIFLYPNPADTRELFRFVTGRLPTADEADDAPGQVLGASELLNNSIMHSLRTWSTTLVKPYDKAGKGLYAFRSISVSAPADLGESGARYSEENLPLVTKQTARLEVLMPTLLERNCRAIINERAQEDAFNRSSGESDKKFRESVLAAVSGAITTAQAEIRKSNLQSATATVVKVVRHDASFQRKAKFEIKEEEVVVDVVDEDGNVQKVKASGEIVTEESEDQIKAQREAEVAKLNKSKRKNEKALEKMKIEIQKKQLELQEIHQEIQKQEDRAKTLIEEYQNKSRALKLIEGGEKKAKSNFKKLETIVENTQKKILDTGKKWDAARTQLYSRYRKAKMDQDERQAQAAKKVDEIKRMRTEMKNIVRDIKNKEEIREQATKELKNMPKSVSRNKYVKRIMDIVASIAKQKEQIKKILADVRQLQRETNKLSDTSIRAFALTDELVFKTARDCKTSAKLELGKTYKSIINMRDKFDQLIELIRDIGKQKKEARDLDSQIESIEARNTTLNMAQIKEDLEQVRAENQELIAELKSLTGQAET